MKNNSLVTASGIGEGEEALFCSTDRELCCNNSNDGSWYLPSGSVVTQRLVTQVFYMTWSYQTVGLNRVHESSSNSLPVGIYHCEMMDETSTTNHLFVGIYSKNEGH